MRKPGSVISIIFLIVFLSLSNSTFAVKKWNNYTDLKNVISIASDKYNQIAYCGTSGGLFVVDLSNNSILKKYTNIEGLVNNNITSVAVDNSDRLWIGSSDGSICILDYNKSSFKYIFDIKNSTENDKSVNSFVFSGNNVFVATGFGIIKISTVTLNFVDAPYYQLGGFTLKTKVSDITVLGNIIYAATASGIANANYISSNLNSPSSWNNYSGSPLNANVKSIKSFDGKIFAGSATGFMYFDGTTWILYPNSAIATASITSIAAIGSKLYFVANNKTYFTPKDTLVNVYNFNVNDICNVVSQDKNGNPLLGIYENGLYNLGIYVAPNCPNRSSFNSISEDHLGNVWGASGLGDGGFYKFDGTNWTTYTNQFYPALGSSNNFRYMFCGNNTVWALNYGNGIVSITDTTLRLYNSYNTNLPGSENGSNYCVPSGGAYDNNGVFWIDLYQTGTGKGFYAKTNDSIWTGITNPGIIYNQFTRFENFIVDNYNTKWAVLSNYSAYKGIYFFNENNLLDTNDNISGKYDVSVFSVEAVYYVTIDKNNVVWIATNNGVFTIDNPLAAIQNPNNPPTPQKVGIISGNLKVPFTESSICIAVDVLNEKWIGTQNNGVFHLSEDGSTLIETFNVNNSPILSNTINSIVVSAKTGKAYFGTLNGLSSIQTNAIQPVEKFDKIICKPNPYVLPSTKNPTLTIDGLVENSIIKIITLNGEVVAEYTARQGKIDDQWNGTDKKGNLVPTGIYIVVAYNKDGSKVGTGKLAIIRK
jgi:ligand-binding sensor domain-containing protein